MENKDLIIVKQLPIIEEQLKSISVKIDKKVKKVLSLDVTDDTVKEIKKARAELNKEFNELEDKRKLVKTEVLNPYEAFEKVYKECVSDKYKSADKELKLKIDTVENELKDKKEEEIKNLFAEHLDHAHIDFVTYDDADINVTLSASMKSLKEKAIKFVDKVVDDLKLIDTQEHKTEILVEYKKDLNVSNAITSVTERKKAIEEQNKKQEELKVVTEVESKVEAKVEETISAPVVEKGVDDDVKKGKMLKLNITKHDFIEISKLMVEGGYDYEWIK